MRLWFINSSLKDWMTLSLINSLANWGERRKDSFCKTAAYPVLGPDPRNWGEETPYYILVSESFCFTNCDWKILYQTVNSGYLRENEDFFS